MCLPDLPSEKRGTLVTYKRFPEAYKYFYQIQYSKNPDSQKISVTNFDPRSCTYQEAIENFDQFCDYFDATARTSYKVSRDNPSGSATPDHRPSETTVDVQTT